MEQKKWCCKGLGDEHPVFGQVDNRSRLCGSWCLHGFEVELWIEAVDVVRGIYALNSGPLAEDWSNWFTSLPIGVGSVVLEWSSPMLGVPDRLWFDDGGLDQICWSGGSQQGWFWPNPMALVMLQTWSPLVGQLGGIAFYYDSGGAVIAEIVCFLEIIDRWLNFTWSLWWWALLSRWSSFDG